MIIFYLFIGHFMVIAAILQSSELGWVYWTSPVNFGSIQFVFPEFNIDQKEIFNVKFTFRSSECNIPISLTDLE